MIEHLASPSSDVAPAASSPSPEYVLTLVHGTFAADAPWIGPSSWFSEKVRSHVAGAATFDFTWSGDNSTRARLNAALELANELRGRVARYPQAKHFIVAHSHGGNVAMYALRLQPELQHAIAGVACLATPFLTGTPRDLERVVRLLRTLWRGSTLMLAIGLGFGGLVASDHSMLLAWPLLLAGIVAVHLPYADPGSKRIVRYASAMSGPWADIFEHTTAMRTRMLVARVPLDEAAWWLRIVNATEHFAAGWPVAAAAGRYSALLAYCAVELFVLSRVDRLDAATVIGTALFVAMVFAFVAPLFAAAVLVPAVLLRVLLRGTPVAFGERILESLLLNIRAHADPPREIRASNVRYASLGWSLRHSSLYANERFIEDLVAWLCWADQPDGEPWQPRHGVLEAPPGTRGVFARVGATVVTMRGWLRRHRDAIERYAARTVAAVLGCLLLAYAPELVFSLVFMVLVFIGVPYLLFRSIAAVFGTVGKGWQRASAIQAALDARPFELCDPSEVSECTSHDRRAAWITMKRDVYLAADRAAREGTGDADAVMRTLLRRSTVAGRISYLLLDDGRTLAVTYRVWGRESTFTVPLFRDEIDRIVSMMDGYASHDTTVPELGHHHPSPVGGDGDPGLPTHGSPASDLGMCTPDVPDASFDGGDTGGTCDAGS